MPGDAEMQKSTGGYISVDATAAVERNRAVIEQIRQIVKNPPSPQPPATQPPAPATPEKSPK